jgi:hypothetical protein
VPGNVMISHRGAKYAIGQGPQFYGIWDVTALQSQPLEWWHKTPEGWAAAWTRFASAEVPGTIAPASQPPVEAAAAASRGRRPLIAAGLLAAGVVLGVVGLFHDYVAGSSLAQQPSNLVPHVFYLAAWTASAVLIMSGGVRLRTGALLAAGLSIVTFGLFLADAGTPITDGAHTAGAGLVISLLGWLACAIGSAAAFRTGPANRLSPPAGHDTVPLIMIIVAALGTAIAFAPSWDSYALRTQNGFSQTITAGNAFANPAAVIAGDVAVMVAVFAVVAVAAFWRPVRLGAALAGGAIVAMLGQAISALILVRQPVSPTLFGVSHAQAAGLGLTIHSGLTAIFWVFCAFVAILILLCGWMIISPAAEVPSRSQGLPAGTPGAGGHGYAVASVASYGKFAPVSAPPAAHAPASGSASAGQQ